jgi:hypothetical protein
LRDHNALQVCAWHALIQISNATMHRICWMIAELESFFSYGSSDGVVPNSPVLAVPSIVADNVSSQIVSAILRLNSTDYSGS